MFSEEIKQSLFRVLGAFGISTSEGEIVLEHPADFNHGDYSTSIALKVSKFQSFRVLRKEESSASPRELADEIVKKWQETGLPDCVERVEVAGPGFINIWFSFDAYSRQLTEVLDREDEYGSNHLLSGKKILLEHTSPNPQTTIMLGHLRNNFLGMATANLLQFEGAKVALDDIVNDRGVHLCRSIFGYLCFAAKSNGLSQDDLLSFRQVPEEKVKALAGKTVWQEYLKKWLENPKEWWIPEELNLKSDHANLVWYVLGSEAYKLLPEVQEQVEEILQAWEREEKGVRKIWKKILSWSEDGYAKTYLRIGSRHDWVWHESDHWKEGKKIVQDGLEKGIFRESEGAIVTNLEKFGLPETVVVKTDGTALYITQDLALTKLKKEKFPSDLYIWDIGMEQTLYFKQLFAVIGQLGIIEKEKLFHLSYALINFKSGGKMATRSGSVVMADEILDELHQKASEIIKTTKQELRDKLNAAELDEVAEKTALAAVKYSLLKYSCETTIFFDPEESLALQGNSGPYLQYTYARVESVKRKAQSAKPRFDRDLSRRDKAEARRANLETENFNKMTIQQLSNEETILLRTLYKFPEVIAEAAKTYSPNLICNFLFDLAQKFNLFYDKHRILAQKTEGRRQKTDSGGQSSTEPTEGQSSFRLVLAAAVGQVLKNGLTLLGIEALEKM